MVKKFKVGDPVVINMVGTPTFHGKRGKVVRIFPDSEGGYGVELERHGGS